MNKNGSFQVKLKSERTSFTHEANKYMCHASGAVRRNVSLLYAN